MAIAFSDLTELARSGERIAWRRLCPLALPLLISVLIAAGVVWIRARPDSQAFRIVNPHLAPTANAWTGVALSAAALALVIAAARGRSWALLGILAFTLCDISLYGLRHKPSADLTAFINAIEIPADTPEYRIDPDFRPVYAYTGPTMRGFRVVMGYAAMNPTSALDYYHQLAALRVAGVKWRKTRLGGAPELAQAADQGIDWLEVPDPMPRARFVSQCLVTGNPRRDIENIDLTTVALVNAPIDLSPGPPGTATITEDRPGRIRIGTTTPATQLLVIAERWHQGWKAEIDGAPQALVPVNGDFMGCVVPPGSHEVNLRFEPASLRYETWLTILGLALLALATAATLSLRGN
jgi:hypothetical protein